MYLLTTMLLVWIGVSAISLGAAVLVLFIEVRPTAEDSSASALAPVCRATPDNAGRGRTGEVFLSEAYA